MASEQTPADNRTNLISETGEFVETGIKSTKPLVTLVLPALNEEAIVTKNLGILYEYMQTLEDKYRWEILFIDDGSTDQTGELAELFAADKDNMHVFHHLVNYGLGQAFKFAFSHSRGDYIVTLDIDLSYSPEHIEWLLDKIHATKAKVVIASPYMEEGSISNVPKLRKFLSVSANRFLSLSAQGNLSTLTSMVRAYDAKHVRALDLRSVGMEVMQEIIYKSMLLRARIEEIPAHLDWGLQNAFEGKRSSSMKVIRHSISVLLAGFLFRPFMFFVIPGLMLLLLSLYVNSWVIIHFVNNFQELTQYSDFLARSSAATIAAYNMAPHAFVIGGITLMLSIQLISLGILSLQSKTYFEEIFHLGSTINKYHKNMSVE